MSGDGMIVFVVQGCPTGRTAVPLLGQDLQVNLSGADSKSMEPVAMQILQAIGG